MLNWDLEASYLDLPPMFYSHVRTDVPPHPEWVVFNNDLARELGLGDAPDEDDLAILSGAVPPPGARVFAQAYAGHQYGVFVILGDGRAAVLGEKLNPARRRFDLQLKGSGPTPYARRGDGKAVLGPMLREYFVSEYMAAVGIPTTRSLAVVTTGERVWRNAELPGAVLCRVASSHLRFGTFEFAAAVGQDAELKALLTYTLERHFPSLVQEEIPALKLLEEVGRLQANLVGRWMQVGFVHGVMNTDNMSICGETIDYGPCAFLDDFHHLQVFSSIDHEGRYAFGRQPAILSWNLARLADALLPCFHPDEEQAIRLGEAALEAIAQQIGRSVTESLLAKLGLSADVEAEALLRELLDWMEAEGKDFTRTFLVLTEAVAGRAIPMDTELPPHDWRRRWERLLAGQEDPVKIMENTNPVVIPRNRVLQKALDMAERGQVQLFLELLEQVHRPFSRELVDSPLARPAERATTRFVTFCGT